MGSGHEGRNQQPHVGPVCSAAGEASIGSGHEGRNQHPLRARGAVVEDYWRNLRIIREGLQMVGIVLCLSAGSPLSQCQSFIDLALVESKERVKQILVGAMDDWTNPSPAMIAAWRARAQSF